MNQRIARRGWGWPARRRISGRALPACLVIGALLLGQGRGAANPLVYPKRMVNAQTVDLAPLFAWWGTPRGPRPLGRWKHIQGTLSRESPFGWVIQGKLEGRSGTQLLLLKNPPLDRLRRFRELEDLLPKLESARPPILAVTKLPAYSNTYRVYYGLYRTYSPDYDRIQQAKVQLAELDHRIQAAREELAVLQDKQGRLKVDAFSLQLDEAYQGMPVFDFGFPGR